MLTWFLSWVLDTVATATDAELNDDTVLREQLLEAEMRREMGELTDEEFAEIEADLLARIREIKERREGGSGPLAFGAGEALDTSGDNTLQIEASVSGDFHDPGNAPHTTIVEQGSSAGNLVQTKGGRTIALMDRQPGDVAEPSRPGLPLSPSPRRRSSPRKRRKS